MNHILKISNIKEFINEFNINSFQFVNVTNLELNISYDKKSIDYIKKNYIQRLRCSSEIILKINDIHLVNSESILYNISIKEIENIQKADIELIRENPIKVMHDILEQLIELYKIGIFDGNININNIYYESKRKRFLLIENFLYKSKIFDLDYFENQEYDHLIYYPKEIINQFLLNKKKIIFNPFKLDIYSLGFLIADLILPITQFNIINYTLKYIDLDNLENYFKNLIEAIKNKKINLITNDLLFNKLIIDDPTKRISLTELIKIIESPNIVNQPTTDIPNNKKLNNNLNSTKQLDKKISLKQLDINEKKIILPILPVNNSIKVYQSIAPMKKQVNQKESNFQAYREMYFVNSDITKSMETSMMNVSGDISHISGIGYKTIIDETEINQKGITIRRSVSPINKMSNTKLNNEDELDFEKNVLENLKNDKDEMSLNKISRISYHDNDANYFSNFKDIESNFFNKDSSTNKNIPSYRDKGRYSLIDSIKRK